MLLFSEVKKSITYKQSNALPDIRTAGKESAVI
jgi:hypothetical protein